MSLLVLCTAALFACLANAASRTSPPSGAIVVNPDATSGQFKTLGSAIASLPDDSSARTVFMFPGTYREQVLIDRPGPVTVSQLY